MADDIVTYTRTHHHHPLDAGVCLMCEAVDEIERLRAAGRELHAWITVNATFIQQERLSHDKVLEAWEEACRG